MGIILFLLQIFNQPLAIETQKQGPVDSLKHVLATLAPDTQKIKAYQQLTDAYVESNTDSCLFFGSKGIALAKKLGDKKSEASLLNKIGKSYDYFGNKEKALKYFLESLSTGERIQTSDGKFICLVNYLDISEIYSTDGDFEKSLSYRLNTLDLFQAIRSSPAALRNIDLKFGIEENSPLWKSIEGAIYDGIGRNYGYLNNIDSALYYLSEAESIYKETGNEELRMAVMFNIAVIYHNMNALEMALNTFSAILESKKNKPADVFYTLSLSRIGQIYRLQGKYEEAILAFRKILASLAAQNSADEKRQAYLDLSETYKLKNDYKMAYLYRDSVLHIADSLDKLNNQAVVAAMKVKFETLLKEKKIKLLEQDNILKDFKVKQEQLLRRLLIGGIVSIFLFAILYISYLVKKQKTAKLIADEKITSLLRDQELKSVSEALEIQENERRRIASDLHDRLGSMLSTIKIYFSSVEEHINLLKEQSRIQYNTATTLLDEACDEVRKISHNLVSGELVKFGLVSALEQMVKTIEDAGKIKIKMLVHGLPKRLDNAVEIPLYRIIQELMNNILKHSKATVVTIQLNRSENNLNIVVEDNGMGFDVAGGIAKSGMGLKNIESRVRQLNGQVYFDSKSGRGTTVIIDLPV